MKMHPNLEPPLRMLKPKPLQNLKNNKILPQNIKMKPNKHPVITKTKLPLHPNIITPYK